MSAVPAVEMNIITGCLWIVWIKLKDVVVLLDRRDSGGVPLKRTTLSRLGCCWRCVSTVPKSGALVVNTPHNGTSLVETQMYYCKQTGPGSVPEVCTNATS